MNHSHGAIGEPFRFSRLTSCGPNGRKPMIEGHSASISKRNLHNLDLEPTSQEDDLFPGLACNDAEMEVFISLQTTKVEIGEYSRKVFIGGVSEGVTLEDMYHSFSAFGSLSIDWPHRLPGDQPPRGYVFLIFAQPASVNRLIQACKSVRGKFCHEIKLASDGELAKRVQVRPWRNCDRTWFSPDITNYDDVDKRFSVFLGAVPRVVTAREIADLVNGLIGNVSFVSIEVDFETDYPKGAARVIFTRREEYVKAIASKIITVCSTDAEKEMEVKPYLEDNMLCEGCGLVKTRLFCAELRCLRYLCGQCWKNHHESAGLRDHKHMVKGMFYSRAANVKNQFNNCASIEPSKQMEQGTGSQCLQMIDKHTFSTHNKSMFDFKCGSQSKTIFNDFKIMDDWSANYSCKVFVGGLRDGLTFDRLKRFVSLFASALIEWPNQEWTRSSPQDGYAFIIFENEEAVNQFLARCFVNSHLRGFCLLLDDYQPSDTILQVHPWRKSYGLWQNPTISSAMQKQIGARLSVFLGGLPRTVTAEEVALEMQVRFGVVVTVQIDVDFEYEYPKGTARVVFSSSDPYRKAIWESTLTMNSFGITKEVEIKPYLEDKVIYVATTNSDALVVTAGSCIPYNRTCDGVNDCPLGDDEGPVCDACKQLHCSWRCDMTASGSRCTCPEGSTLSNDGYTCTEVNECETDGRRCRNYCEDHSTGYDCTCAPGYSLQKDGYSCRISGSKEGMLFVSLGTEIRSMPLSEGAATSSYEVAQQIDNHGLVRSIQYMNRNKQLFMAVSGLAQEGELAVSTDGIMHVLRENIPGIGQVAVDWIGGNVFYTQKATSPGIHICNFNGFYCRQIVYGENNTNIDPSRRQTYRELIVDPQHGNMFWIEGHDNVHRIRMANLDGSNAETLLDSKLDHPSGLAIDPIRGDLYFGDVEKEMIECVNIYNKRRTVILTGGVHQPHELAYFNGFLYWSDWGTESLKVAEISHHHSSSHVVHSFKRFPYGISINHPHYQTIKCPWICVSVPGPDDKLHPKCLCPENYEADEDSCVPRKTNTNDQNTSWMGVGLMEQMCATKEACLNDGVCENQRNEHGRVIRITCVCPEGFEGDRCELANDQLISEKLEESSSTLRIVILLCLIFLAAAAAVFYFAFRNVNSLGSSFDRCFDYVEKKCDSFPGAGGLGNLKDRVKKYVPNMPSLSPRSSSEEVATSSGTSAFNNPIFSANVPEYDEPAVGVSEHHAGNNFPNPMYSTVATGSVTGSPFSEYEVCYSKRVVQ